MRVLVTGAAGFIGAAVAHRLLDEGRDVTGIDNLNAYYDPALKRARLDRLTVRPGFSFQEADIADRGAMAEMLAPGRFASIVHLAAQAGVRHSISHPEAFIDANLVGFANVLEGARRAQAAHLVFASSSSVYGLNAGLPYAAGQPVDHPISLYAATKRANELMAHAYAHLHGLPVTGLRFFTVYGPWGRPDMAYYGFTRKILAGEPIEVFHEGRGGRDFTYVDDVAEAVARVLAAPPQPGGGAATRPDSSSAPFRVLNIGNSAPVGVTRFIDILEQAIGRRALRQMMPAQPGDVEMTAADVSELQALTGFSPSTPLEDGLAHFVAWYRSHHGDV